MASISIAIGPLVRSLTLRLPFPPSLNRIWRAVQGRVVLSAAAREWSSVAANALPRGRVAAPFAGRLAVTLLFRPPSSYGRRRWDIANREKLLCDLLTKLRVWVDDEQIDTLLILRGEPFEKGCVDILIQEY